MSAPDAAAAILGIGATLYAVFGGADFGAGIWDLLARGGRGREARKVVIRSLTPVWEANHVWLIFCLVVLWTAFSQAFAAVMSTLFIPLCLAALGIVLRGAGFAFRSVIEGESAQRAARLSFAASSLLTPFFMGTVVGAVATERVPAAGDGDLVTSWLAPAPLAIGALFVATSAYLAAVLLSVDAALRPLGREPSSQGARSDPGDRTAPVGAATAVAGGAEPSLQGYFIRRALAAAVAAGLIAAVGLVALHADAEYVFDRLTGAALPLVAVSAVAGMAALLLLVMAARREGFGRWQLRLVRPLAALAVVSVIWAWGIAQYPYLLPTSLTLAEAAAPAPTLAVIFVVFGVAAVLILPALALLYLLTARGRLGE